MVRKKTVESVEETKLPQALIVGLGEPSSFLAATLKERGCQVVKLDSYPLTTGRPAYSAGKFDYVFLFDNQSIADQIFEKHLVADGKFILIETTEEEIHQMGKIPHHRFKILRVGDPVFWSMPELVDKILHTMFSASTSATVDLHRKPAVSVKKKKATRLDQAGQATYKSERDVESARVLDINTVPPLLEKTHRFNFKKIIAASFALIFITVLILGSVSFWYVSKLQKTFAGLEYHLESSNLTAAALDFAQTKKEIKTLRGVYNFSTNLLFPLKNISYIEDAGILIDLGEKAISSGEDFVSAAADLLPQAGFEERTDNISKEKLQVLEKKLTNFTAILIETQGKIDKVSLPYFPRERLQTTLSPVISKLTSAYEILPVVEQIIFQDAAKVYLVLFQNNMELRPTGGFIGSYGLLTISNGRILNFKIEDVYTADGQLKGHVDPPLPIRKYLQQPHFFLRDSNFDPDFAASAVQAAWFLQKELGKNVDGVIGVNLILAQKLMQIVGPMKLSDFGGEEITADNFFYKLHYLTQTNFFPGSTQKKDVLTAVANGISAKLGDSSPTDYLRLSQVIKQALDEKNILIYLDDESLQKIIEDHGWAGRMVKVACVAKKDGVSQQLNLSSDPCLPDYLSIVEANLGVNKANYFISKSTVVEKKITSDGGVSTTVTIFYENLNNTAINTPQTYTNYLRIFVPLGSKLSSVTLNNAPLAAADLDSESYGSDKTSFGFLVRIAPENRGVVKFTYLLPGFFPAGLTSYQLFYQKQAGDKNSPLIFSLTYPPEYILKPVNFSSTTQRDSEIFYTTDTSVDRVFALRKE